MSETSETLFQLRDGSKSYGSRVLFDHATFSVNADEHVGVIGPNGAGKTTLFKVLANQETLDGGEVIKSRQLKMAYLTQHDDWDAHQTVEDYLIGRCEKPIWELKAFAKQLGLDLEFFSKSLNALSGGYRMRVKLLALFGANPNLMLLDEPTNYLDLETLLVLERFLQNFQGAFLVISHDREFLKRVTDHTVEVEGGDIVKYNGNIDDYFEQKQMLREHVEKAAASQALRRAEIQSFIDRFRAKATKAKQAQARMKMLDRMEKIEIKALPVSATIRIPPPDIRPGKRALAFIDAQLGYPTKTVLKKVSLVVNTGDKVGVVGLNGAGKSTFLKSLAGELPVISGQRELGFAIHLGLYAQHVAERLDLDATIYEEMDRAGGLQVTRQDVLDMAGSLLFSGTDVEKKIRVLSGGERARVALGKILLGKFPCLLLDEPTNHLDFYTVEALTQALMAYPGTVIVVSHDRSFIGRVSSKILEINDGHVSLYPGTYEEYVWSQHFRMSQLAEQNGGRSETASVPRASAVEISAQPADTSRRWEQKKNLEVRLRQIERRIPQIEKRMVELKILIDQCGQEITVAPSDELKGLADRLSKSQSELNTCEEEWLEITDEQNQKLAQLREIKGE